MKVAYEHLIKMIPSRPSIDEISEKLFQLGHEHEVEDNVFDMELTPNRGDCLSIIGLVRELSVFYETKMDLQKYQRDIEKFDIKFFNNVEDSCPIISFLRVDIDDEISSYRGSLKKYFDDLGSKSINFFTDISNYISYETGQPTHCYDAKKIDGELELKIFEGEEKFESLLGTDISLDDKNLVFTLNDEIINLAGIVGGRSTQCSENTRSVIIECAYFNPEDIISKTVKYNIKSDAAYKFERGVDPMCHENVLRRFLKIIENHASIKNVQLAKFQFKKFDNFKLRSDIDQVNKILGLTISKEKFHEYLDRLGFIFIDNHILVPSHRNDIKTQNDIAEEVARVIGYNNIPMSTFHVQKNEIKEDLYKAKSSKISNFLIKHGFNEVINYPFVAKKSKTSIRLDNPLDSNREFLRVDLKNSLIENLLFNERRQKDSIKLFEFSDVYYFEEKLHSKKLLGLIASGRVDKNYVNFSNNINKEYLEEIIKKIFPDSNINIEIEEILRDSLDTKINNKIFYLEFELSDGVLDYVNETFESKSTTSKKFTKYEPISEYPISKRDLSFSIKDAEDYELLQRVILDFKDEILVDTFIFDFYVNDKSKEIKLGFRFTFQSKNSTVKDSDIQKVVDKIISKALAIDSVSIPGL